MTLRSAILVFLLTFLFLGTTVGPNNASASGNYSSDGTGDVPWTNPGNALAIDGSFATTLGLGLVGSSDNLIGFGYFSSGDIPVGATLDSVYVDVYVKATLGTTVSEYNYQIQTTAGLGTNLAGNSTFGGGNFTTSLAHHILEGNVSTSFGTVITRADLIGSAFEVLYSVTTGGDGTDDASLDNIRVTVVYHTASGETGQVIGYARHHQSNERKY